MSFELFNTNADICTKMASATKSHEVRNQWNQLAAHWRSKAAAYKSGDPVRTNEGVKQLELNPLTAPEPHPPQADGGVVGESKANLADVRVLLDVAPALAPHDEQAALDEIWQALQPRKSAPIASPR